MEQESKLGLNRNEYDQFLRMMTAMLDRAAKAELLQFDLLQANKRIESLLRKIEELEKSKI